jgi:hypothetical protein
LGALSTAPNSESLALVETVLDDAELANDASLATVLIAENMADGDKAKSKGALEKAVKAASSDGIRQRAQEILATL